MKIGPLVLLLMYSTVTAGGTAVARQYRHTHSQVHTHLGVRYNIVPNHIQSVGLSNSVVTEVDKFAAHQQELRWASFDISKHLYSTIMWTPCKGDTLRRY